MSSPGDLHEEVEVPPGVEEHGGPDAAVRGLPGQPVGQHQTDGETVLPLRGERRAGRYSAIHQETYS